MFMPRSFKIEYHFPRAALSHAEDTMSTAKEKRRELLVRAVPQFLR
jgi:hypothetical protein